MLSLSHLTDMEKYPRGRRGSPAKGVVRETVARVQIPLSPPLGNNTNSENEFVLFFSVDYFGIVAKRKESIYSKNACFR